MESNIEDDELRSHALKLNVEGVVVAAKAMLSAIDLMQDEN